MTKTFEAVRTRLVEAGVRRLYEQYLGREILIHYGTVWKDSNNTERSFDPPVRARVVETHTLELTRWMGSHLDPYWDVAILDHHGHLGPGETIYGVYGLGWSPGEGYQRSSTEWELASEGGG